MELSRRVPTQGFGKLLKESGIDAVPRGFRSWCSDTLVTREPGERALAHKRHLANRIIRRMWRDETTRRQPLTLAA